MLARVGAVFYERAYLGYQIDNFCCKLNNLNENINHVALTSFIVRLGRITSLPVFNHD